MNKQHDMQIGIGLLEKFAKQTSSLTRKFGKMASKMNGKKPEEQKEKSLAFAQKYLRGIWDNAFMKEFFSEDEIANFSNDEINTYIIGVFIASHSKELERVIVKTYETTIEEMVQKAKNPEREMPGEDSRRND